MIRAQTIELFQIVLTTVAQTFSLFCVMFFNETHSNKKLFVGGGGAVAECSKAQLNRG